jgi:hypothetical protein
MILQRAVSPVLAIMLCIAPGTMGAQPAANPLPNASLMARADSISVSDYCRIAQQVLASPAVLVALAADSSLARMSAATICDPLLSSFSLLALSGRAPAPLAAVARLRTEGYSAARKGIFDAMSEFRARVRADGVREVVSNAIGAELNSELVRVTTTAQSLLTADARDRALARLARYERKLGPTSAKLNGPEVLLNYAAQRWIPGFRATPLGGPSPLELVASYVPGYVTSTNGRVQPVSASEFGVRYYLFGETFGASGTRGLLFPSYWSIGVITASDRNGALVWPWEGSDHSGGYFSWGSIKVGYVKGRQGKWLVSKQFQAVPLLF